jgi:membrane protease YdiL (CAAX protease family)
MLFRGIIQGYFLQQPMARQRTWIGLSTSNLLTSLLFACAHLASHSISWSLLVFVPSLCFGFVRDRFGSVYPSFVLHAFYNAGYFLLIDGAIV